MGAARGEGGMAHLLIAHSLYRFALRPVAGSSSGHIASCMS